MIIHNKFPLSKICKISAIVTQKNGIKFADFRSKLEVNMDQIAFFGLVKISKFQVC